MDRSDARIGIVSGEILIVEIPVAAGANRPLVREFTPLRPAMEPWGAEIPASR